MESAARSVLLAVSPCAAHMMPQISSTPWLDRLRIQSGAEQAVDAIEGLFG